MCGITGAVWTDPRSAVDRPTLERMTSVLAHRGPDDEGYYTNSLLHAPHAGAATGVALGHRRLSIIDLAGGRQPMANEDGGVQVVFNGEIYNYRVLRKRLEGSGHRFQTDSDTEVLVHLYEDEGVDFVRHLNGMFALALWDARLRQLVLARDRLGKKPLYYRLEPARLLFGSELKSLLQTPDAPREVDPAALDEYLTYQYVPHPNTILRGVRKLSPAHTAVYRDGALSVRRYWDVAQIAERDRPGEEYIDELRASLTSAVELRLQSDAPLGAFLSGGLDSSIVVALMQQLCREPVKTFSIGFSVPEYDETSYARQVAQHLGTQHEEFRVEPSAVDLLPKLVWHYDEPMADSSAIPTWCVAELSRRFVKVALTGDGGDELFAGYPRYRAVTLGAWFDRLPRSVRRVLTAGAWQKLPGGGRQKGVLRRFKRLVEALGQPEPERYLNWISIFNFARRAELYEDDFVRRLPNVDPAEFLRREHARFPGRDPVTAVSLTDLVTYLPCDLMTKVDIASMAHGLECRQPLLDYRVVELAAAMPRRLKFRRLRGKRILLEAFGHLLPPAVRNRSKMGFGVPLDHWFRGELRDYVRDVLLDSRARQRGFFRPAAVEKLIDEHQSRRFDHSYRLWALLVFELWSREWLDASSRGKHPVTTHTTYSTAPGDPKR